MLYFKIRTNTSIAFMYLYDYEGILDILRSLLKNTAISDKDVGKAATHTWKYVLLRWRNKRQMQPGFIEYLRF